MDHRSWQVAAHFEESSRTDSKRVQETPLWSYKHFRAAQRAMEPAQRLCSQKKGGGDKADLDKLSFLLQTIVD